MEYFGQLFMQNPWTLLARREALERLQAAGVRGLQGCPIKVRFRTKHAPELLELQMELRGQFHPECLPSGYKPRCPTCGSNQNHLPKRILLDASSLPEHVDVFRFRDWWSCIIANERFVETVKRLELDGVVFEEMEVRQVAGRKASLRLTPDRHTSEPVRVALYAGTRPCPHFSPGVPVCPYIVPFSVYSSCCVGVSPLHNLPLLVRHAACQEPARLWPRPRNSTKSLTPSRRRMREAWWPGSAITRCR